MFKKLRKLLRQPLGAVAISFGLFPFMAPKQQPYVVNFERTINFFQPAPKWPVEKLLTPTENQVLQQYGRPDMFRFLWNPNGDLKMRERLQLEWTRDKVKDMPPSTWVYLQRNEEIVFSGNTFKAQPLTEAMQLIIKYGDPENVRDIGGGVQQWTFYSVGKIFNISPSGAATQTREFPPMGSFHK